MFRHNNNHPSLQLLKQILQHSEQSRALLFVGEAGWGKLASALDTAQQILQQDPLQSSDFFYFRNDRFGLKAQYFLNYYQNRPESWTFLALLQRRINLVSTLDESLSLPTGVKLPAIKEQLNDALSYRSFPQDEKFIHQLIQVCQVLEKKQNMPINVIREAIRFHNVQSNGRVSVLAQFDLADNATQNAALKLLEEPHPNHWIILTAENIKNVIPTILSRTLKINFPKPKSEDFDFMVSGTNLTSSVHIMEEEVFQLSTLKFSLLKEFFQNCIPSIERSMNLFFFIDKLNDNQQSALFLELLIEVIREALLIRQYHLRQLPPLDLPYQEYSTILSKASTAELEELVQSIEKSKGQVLRSVIKDSHILPALLLEIARCVRKVQN